MKTSPIDSYEGGLDVGAYFTWADNNTMIVVMTILGFAFSMWALWKFVMMEKAALEHSAAELAGKYRSE